MVINTLLGESRVWKLTLDPLTYVEIQQVTQYFEKTCLLISLSVCTQSHITISKI